MGRLNGHSIHVDLERGSMFFFFFLKEGAKIPYPNPKSNLVIKKNIQKNNYNATFILYLTRMGL